jgi:1-acyl-sn-glycerol-3-phosphate acyltransferase
MLFSRPLLISQQLLSALGTRIFFHHQDRIPRTGSVLVVSNHRSFMDAMLLMVTLDRPIRFACHRYMDQVPFLREFVTQLGCLPLDAPAQRQQRFFDQAIQLLQARQAVGIFPEGAQPMVQLTVPQQVGAFQRGFAHLALRTPIDELALLPVAIVPHTEQITSFLPLQLLSWFDPSEPLFQQAGPHPLVIYRHVTVRVGHPVWVTPTQRQHYHGKHAKSVVADLTTHCQSEIQALLDYGS